MNKRPIVYVARKLNYYDENNQSRLAGYYVSRAYLNFEGKWYNKDGAVTREYIIDFANTLEMLDDNVNEFYAEKDLNTSTDKVFKNYKVCNKLVNLLNSSFEKTVGSDSESKTSKLMKLHKKALKYGEQLEQKFIPSEEREQVNENIKNI